MLDWMDGTLNIQCTNLNDHQAGGGGRLKDHDAEQHDNEPPLSLGKTYEEVMLQISGEN